MNGIIKELRNAAALIANAADELEQQSGDKPAQEQELKLEDVRAVLADISRRGKTEEVRELLQKYGADRLSKVDPANYPALLKDAEELENE